jgi:UDP-glucose 4-epimerase
MGKIGLTGGAGFVGTNLAKALQSEGYEIVVVDDFSTGLRSNLDGIDCETREVSIVDESELERAFKGCSHIYHLAARGSVPRSIKNPKATFEVNVNGTLNVLEVARKIGAQVAFSSSSSVYGSNLDLPKNEKMWMSPLTPYAASKLAGESLIQSYSSSYQVPAISYRFFNIFGPWQRPDHDYAAVIPKWIWKLLQSEEIEIFGDGEHSRDFTYIDTVVDILIRGMKEEISHPSPVNLALGSRITLNQVVSILKKDFPNLKVKYLTERNGDVRSSQNDPTLLRNLFPDIKSINFEDAITSTIEWYRQHGAAISNGPRVLD